MTVAERFKRWVALIGAVAALMAVTTGTAHGSDVVVRETLDEDIVGPDTGVPSVSYTLAQEYSRYDRAYVEDPYIAWKEVTLAPTGIHVWQVWRCDFPESPKSLDLVNAIAAFGPRTTKYFEILSRGRYSPQFEAHGAFSVDSGELIQCLSDDASPVRVARPNDAGALVLNEDRTGGLGGPGSIDRTDNAFRITPGTRRAVAGEVTQNDLDAPEDPSDRSEATILHEMGHALGWPHVFSQGTNWLNVTDVMAASLFVDVDGEWVPTTTTAINLYAAGWIDAAEVDEWVSGTTTIRIGTPLSPRTKMIIVPTSKRGTFYTISVLPARYDSPSARSVLIHYVDQSYQDDSGFCFGEVACTSASRLVEILSKSGAPEPADREFIEGESLSVETWTVRVETSYADGFTVKLSGKASGTPPPVVVPPIPAGFIDTVGHLFEKDIDRLAAAGITRGCNPTEGNTRFCPDDFVTRGQMAAFLTRALNLKDVGPPFADTEGHLFESDIRRLAAAGVTRGCNPADGNTRFCPDDFVTRGQMAAFLVRALELTALTATFEDTRGHLFEGDIRRLAAAGITRGCNPTEGNTRFCPDDFVTRGQMAAFVVRAGLTD